MKIWNIMKHDWILSDLLTQMFLSSPCIPKEFSFVDLCSFDCDEEIHHHLHFLLPFQKEIDHFLQFPKSDK